MNKKIAVLGDHGYKSLNATMSEFNGITYIHLREYIFDEDSMVEFPTKKGYAFSADYLDLVIAGLTELSRDLGSAFKNRYSKQLDLFYDHNS